MLSVLALLAGEALVFGGLWWVFPPLALVVLGVQLAAVSLVREVKVRVRKR